ncbi:MAG TPA: hypothetical protein VNF75_04645 [Candidatus Dormibacteraeota bacterium]|nr:hypothetical protein [Candidatus Dormibacteraeota bacterium]
MGKPEDVEVAGSRLRVAERADGELVSQENRSEVPIGPPFGG